MKTKKTNEKRLLNINFEQKLTNWLAGVVESDIGCAFRKFILRNALTSSVIIVIASLILGILMQNIGNGLTLGGSLIICIGIMSAFEIQKTIDTIRATQSEVISAEKRKLSKARIVKKPLPH